MRENRRSPSVEKYLNELFSPSEEQKKILEIGALKNKDFWKNFGPAMLELALESYSLGEISLQELLEAVSTTSIGCDVMQRLTLFGIAGAQAITIIPKTINKRTPEFARWQKYAVAELALLCEENGMTISPNSSKSAITSAIELNSAMKIIKDGVNVQTVYKWVLEVKKKRGMPVNKTGPRLQEE